MISVDKHSPTDFRDFLQFVPDAIILANLDGGILYVNPQAETIFGYSRAELSGKRVEELMPERYRQKHTGHRKGYSAVPKLRPMGQALKLFGLRKNGEEFPVEIMLNHSETVDGPVIISAIRDVTERVKTEERLQATLRELEDFKAALDEHAILAITDPQGRITYANDQFCKISKYSRKELLGQDHRLLNSGWHPQELFRDLWQTIGQGKVWRGEIRNRAKDGTYYWVDATIVPFVGSNGKPTQYVAIRKEITDRKLVEAEREKLIEELTRALAEVKTLSGLLPICANCKKVRDDSGYWSKLETYLSENTRAQFSHGYCPDCAIRFLEESGMEVPDEMRQKAAEQRLRKPSDQSTY